MKNNQSVGLLKDKRKDEMLCLWRLFNKTEGIAKEINVSSSVPFGEILFLVDNIYPRWYLNFLAFLLVWCSILTKTSVVLKV